MYSAPGRAASSKSWSRALLAQVGSAEKWSTDFLTQVGSHVADHCLAVGLNLTGRLLPRVESRT
jgi:hypothetical protein